MAVPHLLPAICFGLLGLVVAGTIAPMIIKDRNRYFIAASTLGLEYLLVKVVYRLTWHPLAKYPGPLFAACTDWYISYWILSGDRHLELQRLHKKHGKFVRVGPSRVTINSAAASRDLHNIHANTVKSLAYGSFKYLFGSDASNTTRNLKMHAFRRRINAAALTPAAVKTYEHRILPHVDYLIDSLAGECSDVWTPAKDMSDVIAYCISDIMRDVTFSQNWNLQRDPSNRAIVHDLPRGAGVIHMTGHMHSLFFANIHKIILYPLLVGTKRFTELSTSFALKRQEDEEKSRKSGAKFNDLWSFILKATDPNTGRGFTFDELVSEAGILIVAGSDTTTATTVATLFYLLHYPNTLDRLTREIRETFPAVSDRDKLECPARFASPELQAMTYLLACIDEAMRLSPAIPSALPREVRAGGIVVDGEFFPEGTDLGIPHYLLHRDEKAFPEPEVYKPERWLDGDGDSEYKAGAGLGPSFTPFGVGRYSCIGKHLAYQEVSYILARILWQYDIRLEPGNTLGEGRPSWRDGRRRSDELQIYCSFVSYHKGPAVQFRQRQDLVSNEAGRG